jgi:hypothetical protein
MRAEEDTEAEGELGDTTQLTSLSDLACIGCPSTVQGKYGFTLISKFSWKMLIKV